MERSSTAGRSPIVADRLEWPAANGVLSRLPPVAASLALTALVWATLWPWRSGDMVVFLEPWLAHIVSVGPIAAFATPFSNYSPPYLYLLALAAPLVSLVSLMTTVKLVAVAGCGLLALALRSLFAGYGVRAPGRAAALVFLLPSVGINAALMGQCDALYAAAIVMALSAGRSGRNIAMLAWCGVAFALKAQTLFLVPFVLAVVIARRVRPLYWLAAPAAAIGVCAPALIAGWPISHLLSIYLAQAHTFHDLARYAPNGWTLFRLATAGRNWDLIAPGLIVAAAAAAWLTHWLARRTFDGSDWLRAALLCVLVVPGLLPKMHDRYFFLADVIAFALAIVVRNRPAITIAALVQAGSTLALLGSLFEIEAVAGLGALAMIAATVLVARSLVPTPAPQGHADAVRP